MVSRPVKPRARRVTHGCFTLARKIASRTAAAETASIDTPVSKTCLPLSAVIPPIATIGTGHCSTMVISLKWDRDNPCAFGFVSDSKSRCSAKTRSTMRMAVSYRLLYHVFSAAGASSSKTCLPLSAVIPTTTGTESLDHVR